jgi:hypothetical protein
MTQKEADFKYKVIEITQDLVAADHGTNKFSVESKAGWDIQQIFSRLVGPDSERVYALLRRHRD